MENDKYETYKSRIQDRFVDACNSLSELDSCHTSKELLESTKEKILSLFNEMDFVCANACSLHDTDNHEVGKWFADTSKDAFYALAAFCKISNKIAPENKYLPSEKAFASMQRLIIIYLPKKQVAEVTEVLSDAGITITGFKEKHKFRMTKSTERIISIVLAILSVIFLAILIPNINEPSARIYNFYCVLISLLGGYSAAAFTGTLDLSTNKIKAKSGFAVFIVIFFILQGLRVFN